MPDGVRDEVGGAEGVTTTESIGAPREGASPPVDVRDLNSVRRALRAINFHVLTERSGIANFLKQGGMMADTTAVFGVLAYWLVILASMLIAFNGLGLTYITDLLGRVVLFLPKVMVALLILAFGAYFARFIGNAVTAYCRNVHIQDLGALDLSEHAALGLVDRIAFHEVANALDPSRATPTTCLSVIG